MFEVWAEGERLADERIVRGPQAPVPIAADVTAFDTIAPGRDPGGDGNAFDHADWGNARLACSG